MLPSMLARLTAPAAVFVVCAGVYVATLGPRIAEPTPDRHFVHLANSYLHGQLHVVGNKPPTQNDWALYEGRWYVSFPPLPAILIMPAVAIWGTGVWDRLFWAVFAGLGPLLLLRLLARLRSLGLSERSARDDLLLTGLFAFGSVYYYASVQGSVWFAAHVVASVLIAGYLLNALGAHRPALAGVFLGLSILTRPPTLLLGVVFLVEVLAHARTDVPVSGSAPVLAPGRRLLVWLRGVDWPATTGPLARFSVPVLIAGGVAMALNYARFDDPLAFGHEFLRIRWRARIDRWGLFNYHYLARNLAVFLAALPWLSATAPFVKISRHGLALWFTTPNLLWLLWPRRSSASLWGLGLGAGLVAGLDLLYQNTGWIQFGYRFSLDYLVVLFAMLAIGGRRFGLGFHLLMVAAMFFNTFGAVTFDRMHRFYDRDRTQKVIFQPD